MDGVLSRFPIIPQSFKTSPPNIASLGIQIAETQASVKIAYKIRHDGYFSYNYITERDDGLFQDKYDLRQNVRTVVVFKNGIPAATVRLCLLDTTGGMPDADTIPAMEIFESEIRCLMASLSQSAPTTRAVEVTRMARAPEFSNDMTVIHAIFRAVGYLILYFNADVVLNACRPHHMPMYRRFGFQKLEEPRQYPNLTYKAGLLACFRPHFGVATSKLSFLNGISTEDFMYRSLVAGRYTELPTKSDG